MAKRHASLVPLSHAHHRALVLAHRLQRGLAGSTDPDWPAEPTDQVRYVAAFQREHLEPHFRAEEEAVFPALTSHSREAEGLVEALREEHRHLREAVAHLQVTAIEALPRALAALGVLLEGHVRREERDLFPRVQQHVPEEALARMGEAIRKILG